MITCSKVWTHTHAQKGKMSRGAAAAAARNKRHGFSGFWILDASRSDSPAIHLEGMGLPIVAQTAASQVTPIYEFRVPGDGSVTIRHMSEVGEKSRTLRLGVEHVESGSKDGSKISMFLEMPSPSLLVNHIDWSGRGKITDTRTLIDDGLGGFLLHQHVEFVHVKGKSKTVSERFFVRREAGADA